MGALRRDRHHHLGRGRCAHGELLRMSDEGPLEGWDRQTVVEELQADALQAESAAPDPDGVGRVAFVLDRDGERHGMPSGDLPRDRLVIARLVVDAVTDEHSAVPYEEIGPAADGRRLGAVPHDGDVTAGRVVEVAAGYDDLPARRDGHA